MEDKHVTLAEFNQLFGIQVQDHVCPPFFFLPFFVIHLMTKVSGCVQRESDSNRFDLTVHTVFKLTWLKWISLQTNELIRFLLSSYICSLLLLSAP